MLINVLDHADVATAIAVANDGDRVYFPGVKQYDAPVAGWRIQKSLELFGDGPGDGSGSTGSVLRPAPSAIDAMFVLDPVTSVDLPRVYVHDLCITSPVPNTRTGLQGIRFASESQKKLSELRLERLSISWLGDAGVQLHGRNASTGAVVGVGVFDCDISNCGKQGISFDYCWATEIVRSRFRKNQLQGLLIRSEEIALYGCLFEDNCLGGGDAQLSAYDDRQFPFEVVIFRVDGCVFRSSSPSFTGCRLRQFKGGLCIGGCLFEQTGTLGGTGIEFAATATDLRGAAIVLPNRFKNLAIAMSVSPLVDLNGLTVWPQYCDPLSTIVQLPSRSEDAPIGSPSVNGPGSSARSGVLVPSYPADPSTQLQLGTLFYNNSSDPVAGKQLRVVKTNADGVTVGWKKVRVL